jgi:hypothetical protein
MHMNALARFEGFMQELMDRRMVRLLGGSLQPVELARGIARCMEARQTSSPAGPSVPNCFEVLLNPEDCADLRAMDPGLERKLSEYAVERARERGFNFQAAPRVRLVADPAVVRGVVDVDAGVTAAAEAAVAPRFSPRRRYSCDRPESRVAGLYFEAPQSQGAPSQLLLDHFPFAIGRQQGNDLVLPDSRVSRRHALIDLAGGRYRLRDLGSRNGTWLNGQQVSEADLSDADHLAIGGFEVVVRISQ